MHVARSKLRIVGHRLPQQPFGDVALALRDQPIRLREQLQRPQRRRGHFLELPVGRLDLFSQADRLDNAADIPDNKPLTGRGPRGSSMDLESMSKQVDAPHSEQESPASVIRFTLTVAAWVVAFFGSTRVGWVQQHLLLPFAGLQQQLAADLMGAPSNAVIVDMSCTGADAIALCLGVIAAFPTSRRARLQGGAIGLLLITALNTVRIGSLSLVADNLSLMNVLHVYVWPGILIVAVAAYVFFWMSQVGIDRGTVAREDGAAATVLSSGVVIRFLLLVALFVAIYFTAAPWLYHSRALHMVGAWSAATGAVIIAAFGVWATTSGNILSTAHGSFAVTQECIATPIIPVYAAAVLSVPSSPAQRVLALLLGAPLFFCVGTARLLVLALPQALVPSHLAAIHSFSQVLAAVLLVAAAALWFHGTTARCQTGARAAMLALGAGALVSFGIGRIWVGAIGATAGAIQGLFQHAGHAYADAQGAFAMLPAFQLGLFVALWIAISGRLAWGRLSIGVTVLALSQLLLYLAVGELHRHVGFDPHVSVTRAWALAFPVVMAVLIERPFRVSDPPTALQPALAGQE